jgi:hypothetical protein
MTQINKLQSISELTNPLNIDNENFANFLANKGVQLFSLENSENNILLIPANMLNFQTIREYLDWEFEQKITTLNQIYQQGKEQLSSPISSPKEPEVLPSNPPSNPPLNPYRKPLSFTPLKTYKETALKAILLQGDKKTQLCHDIREKTNFAVQYMQKIASLYPDKKNAFRGLKDAFTAIAIESQSPNYDWDKA